MSLRVRFQYTTGASLGYSIERLSDGLLYDFATSGSGGTFTASPATPIAPLPADSGNFAGRYKVNLSPTPASQFLDGDYCVTIHNTAASNLVLAEMAVVMRNGDDATSFASGSGGSSSDPWSQALPGAYAPGTAGYLLGTNLDAKVSSRLPSTSYTAPPTDYQQRTAPVVLPATAPSWYAAPSLSQVVAGIWDEPRASHTLAGSFGSSLDAAISSRLAANADSPGTTTMLARLTAARAGYLDSLNIVGVVASHADAVAIQNNTSAQAALPDILQRPASGAIARVIHLYLYDEQGNMATPDAAPAVSVVGASGVGRNANLDSTSMALVSTGHYKATYTLNASDPIEQLAWTFTVVRNGQTRQYGGSTEVVDPGSSSSSGSFTAADRANLNSLLALAGTTGVVVASSSKTGYALTAQEHASITADTVAALNSASPATPTTSSVFDRLDARVSSRSTYAGGPVASVAAPVIVGQNNDKSGYALSSSGLDAVPVEAGINARQALSPILAALGGVISGAGTGTVVVKGGNVATTRILAATDPLGNRSSVVLSLPN